MHRPIALLAYASLVSTLFACDSTPEAPAEPRAAGQAPVVKEPAVTEAPVKPPRTSGMDEATRAARIAKLKEDRALADAYAGGKLGDGLLAARALLVDARAPKDVDQSQHYLFVGAITAPKTYSELIAASSSDGAKPKQAMLGGEDAARSVVFRDIEPGTYTVCSQLGGASDPRKAEFLKASEAALKASGQPMSAESMQAAVAAAKAETGYEPTNIDWSAQPVRCKVAEVTAEAASRVVVLE